MSELSVVLDTNVLVAAVRSRDGASFALLSRLGETEPPYCPVVSVPLVLEYEDALLRTLGQGHLDETDIGELLDFVCSVATHQEIFYLWRPLLKDPGDDHVLEVAVAAGVDYLVTFNLGDFVGAETVGVKLITPQRLLRKLEKRP